MSHTSAARDAICCGTSRSTRRRRNTAVADERRRGRIRGYGNINLRSTSATSSYNSLQVSLSRRLFAGLQLNANYTLSKAVSDASADRGTTQQDIRNLAAERAVTNYDRTHIFGVHYVWELPFYRDDSGLRYNVLGGWEISGSTRYASRSAADGHDDHQSARTRSAAERSGPISSAIPTGAKPSPNGSTRRRSHGRRPSQFGNAPNSVIRGTGRAPDRPRSLQELQNYAAASARSTGSSCSTRSITRSISAVGTSIDAATFGTGDIGRRTPADRDGDKTDVLGNNGHRNIPVAETIDWPPPRRPRRRRGTRCSSSPSSPLIVVGGGTTLSYYVDALWFGSLGYGDVFWKTLEPAGADLHRLLRSPPFSRYTASYLAAEAGAARRTRRSADSDQRTADQAAGRTGAEADRARRLARASPSSPAPAMMAQWQLFALYWHAPRGDAAPSIRSSAGRSPSTCSRCRRGSW